MIEDDAKKGAPPARTPTTSVPPRGSPLPPPPPALARRASTRPPPPLGSGYPSPLGGVRARYPSSLTLPAINYDLANAGRRVVEGALSVVPGESLVVVVDEARRELAAVMVEIARAAGASSRMFVVEEMGLRPVRRVPDAVRDAIANAQASVLLCGFEDGEHPMRVEIISLAKTHGLRHGHMVGITGKSLVPGFSVDPARILDATRAVRTRLRPDSVLRVRSAAGTNLEVRLDPRHRWMEHLGVVRPGRWENLPSGKLTTAAGDVRGVYVSDASVGEHFGATAGLLARTPVRVEIEAGVFKSVHCTDRTLQREIEQHVKREANGDRVGTVTIGTNVGLLSPTGELLCDQNLPGLHISFGLTLAEHTGATWDSRVQLAMTGAAADVDLDGAPLLRSGRYLVG